MKDSKPNPKIPSLKPPTKHPLDEFRAKFKTNTPGKSITNHPLSPLA